MGWRCGTGSGGRSDGTRQGRVWRQGRETASSATWNPSRPARRGLDMQVDFARDGSIRHARWQLGSLRRRRAAGDDWRSHGAGASVREIPDASLLPDSGIAVIDRRAHQVQLFDRSGRLVWSMGREGEGPGEFVDPIELEVSGRAVVVWDWGSRRVTTFELDSDSIATVNILGQLNPTGRFGLLSSGGYVFGTSTRVQCSEHGFWVMHLGIALPSYTMGSRLSGPGRRPAGVRRPDDSARSCLRFAGYLFVSQRSSNRAARWPAGSSGRVGPPEGAGLWARRRWANSRR